MMATFKFSRRPFLWRIVNASRSACVGCSCAPSPALMMDARVSLASVCGVPENECRMTTESAAIASSVFAVSISVSPLETLLVDSEMLTTSADSRLPAISNEVLVRVDASKKRLMTDFPRSVGTFLIGRVETSCRDSATSSISRISCWLRSSMPSRCFRLSIRLVR